MVHHTPLMLRTATLAAVGFSLLASPAPGQSGAPDSSVTPVGYGVLRGDDDSVHLVGRVGVEDVPLVALLPWLEAVYGRTPATRKVFRTRFVVDESPAAAESPAPSSPTAWRITAQASTPLATYRLFLSGDRTRPHIRMRVRVRYSEAGVVAQEVLRFSAQADAGAMVDRAYRWRPLVEEQLAGDLTPQQVRFSQSGFRYAYTGRSTQGLRVERRGSGLVYDVVVELDHRLNHPLFAFKKCINDQHGKLPAQHNLSDTLVRAGETRTSEGLWTVGEFRPAFVARYPDRYRSALVLVDHADRSSAGHLEALAFGETGALARGRVGPEYPGLVNRGLGYTKTVFLKPATLYAEQVGSRRYERVLAALEQRGVEIGVHSPSGERDGPRRTRVLLEEFRRDYSGRTWVDHQPKTNCEALAAQGLDPQSRWYVLQRLTDLGFDLLWAGHHLMNRKRDGINLFAPRQRAQRRPILFGHSRLSTSEQQLFSSMWFFAERREFISLLSRKNLNALSREHGIAIAHVYLETADVGRFADRALLQRRSKGSYRVFPAVDRVFRRLARLQSDKKVWVAGLEEVADHLRGALRQTRTYYLGRGVIRLHNVGRRDLHRLTLALPAEAVPLEPIDLPQGAQIDLQVQAVGGGPFAFTEAGIGVQLWRGAPLSAMR